MTEPVVTHVRGYARRLAPALAAQSLASVASPLGVWLLLAVTAPVATGEVRAELEAALGLPAEDAAKAAGELLSDPPRALLAAAALWVRQQDGTEALERWTAGLPATVEAGPIPSQAEADAWAERHTRGLIRRFPVEVQSARLLLASALATRVSWTVPFELLPSERLSPGRPFRERVRTMLSDHGQGHMAVMETETAGLVGVHLARAKEGLTVASVIAAPGQAREAVTAAAHDVVAGFAGEGVAARVVPLSELPLGTGPAWTLEEREVPGRVESFSAVLPAWHADGRSELLADPVFGAGAALAALLALLPPGPAQLDARQMATATYDRFGFEAAAATALGVRTSMRRSQLGRHLHLEFGHPYAALAVVGTLPPDPTATISERYLGLPAFEAWVTDPVEAQAAAPGGPGGGRGAV